MTTQNSGSVNDMFNFFKNFMDSNMNNGNNENWMTMQRKNIEMLNNAARSTIETFRHIAQLQGQYANQLMQQANSVVHGLTTPGKWEDKLSNAVEMTQQNMQTGVQYGRQMAEKIQDNNHNLIKMFEDQCAENWNEACSMGGMNCNTMNRRSNSSQGKK